MPSLAELHRTVRSLPRETRLGRVLEVRPDLLIATPPGPDARVGAICRVGADLRAQIVRADPDRIDLIPFDAPAAILPGAEVRQDGLAVPRDTEALLGRVVDAFLRPVDGSAPIPPGAASRPSRPTVLARRGLGPRLDTGEPALDVMLPLVRGQRIGIFAGSGVGKTSLLAALAGGVDCDAIVCAMVGERGREVRDFLESALDATARARCICIVATADASAMERCQAAETAVGVAETLRAQGLHVLLLLDSLTRWADAHRQVEAMRVGQTLGHGYPARTVQEMGRLIERLGPGAEGEGDITAVLSVLVAGSDMDEPLADMARGMLDGHVVLSRQIAERGRFPAIDIARSVSRALPHAASPKENSLIRTARDILSTAERLLPLRDAGLSRGGEDPAADLCLARAAALDALWASRDHATAVAAFDALRSILTADAGEG